MPTLMQKTSSRAPTWRTLSADQLNQSTDHLGAEPAFRSMTADQGWQPVTTAKSKTGPIAVSKRDGENGSRLIRIVANAKGLTPQELATTWADIENEPKWSETGVADGAIMTSDNGRMTYWQVVKMPMWTFMSNSYGVNEATTTIGPDGTYYWAAQKAGAEAQASGAELVSKRWRGAKTPSTYRSHLAFRPTEDGTEITSVTETAGIKAPSKIENWVLGNVAPKSVSSLVKEAARRAGKRL